MRSPAARRQLAVHGEDLPVLLQAGAALVRVHAYEVVPLAALAPRIDQEMRVLVWAPSDVAPLRHDLGESAEDAQPREWRNEYGDRRD
jgi:hypothetical protein